MNLSKLSAKADKSISVHVAMGHFATNHSHINYYVDLTHVKSYQKIAGKAALVLAENYKSTNVDTVICLEGTNMIGAFLADELSKPGFMTMNSNADISVLTPEMNSNNQMVFRENTQSMIKGKSVLLMLSSVSTGKTIVRAVDCIKYYSGQLMGICAVFSAIKEIHGIKINSVFDKQDIPDYKTYIPDNCDMCARNEKIDAIVNSFGYSSLY